jgi:tetratricopeptide (TPR) repeat protein
MAGRRRTKPDKARPYAEKRGSVGSRWEGLATLSYNNACALAVLAIAGIWQDRFPGGWVSYTKFKEYGLLSGKTDTLSKAVRRMGQALRKLDLSVDIEAGRVPHPEGGSEEARRIVPPLPIPIERWLLSSGHRYVRVDRWEEFKRSHYEPIETPGEVEAALEETMVRALLEQGAYDQAVSRARSAAGVITNPRVQAPLLLALATALLRRARRPQDWDEAEQILRRLRGTTLPPADNWDRIVQGRVRISLAYCLYLKHLRKVQEPYERFRAIADEVDALLAEAAGHGATLSLRDSGQIANTRGLLHKWEARVALDARDQDSCYEAAERCFRQALTIWHLAADRYSLVVALYNLGDLAFNRYEVRSGHAGESLVREALGWYELSVSYTDDLRTAEWVWDYIMSAECIRHLIPHLVREGRISECLEYIQRARGYLARARGMAQPGTWQGEHVLEEDRRLDEAVRKWIPQLRTDS